MAHGMKTLFKDGRWAATNRYQHSKNPYARYNYGQQQKMAQVKKDFIKFVPFSLFLLIPGAELFLPAWVMIFPNSVPSQFVGDEERNKKFIKLKEQQEDAAEKLLYILPNYLAKMAASPEVPEKDVKGIKELRNMLREDKFLPTDLLEYRKMFRKYGLFRMF